MKYFTVTGVDRKTNYDSIMVIRAPSPEKAKIQSESKGILATKVVEFVPPEPVDVSHDPSRDQPRSDQKQHSGIAPETKTGHPESDAGFRRGAFWLIAVGVTVAAVMAVVWFTSK